MEQFLYYLLRATILSALFYGFYKLLFSKTTFYAINRLTLSALLLTIAVLPLFRFNLLPTPKPETLPMEQIFPIDLSNIPVTEIAPQPSIEIPWVHFLIGIYFIGLTFFLVRYLIGIFQLSRMILKSERQTLADNSVLCLTDDSVDPFSWLNYIVMARTEYSAENRAVLNHEQAHVRLHHSADRTLFDLFTILCWFNPFAWLLRRELQSVHEFQADEQVLTQGINAKTYQLLLIRKIAGETKFAMANSFLQRDLQKRITMMMKNNTHTNRKWNYAIGLPILVLAIIVLSVPKLNASLPEKTIIETTENQLADSIIIVEQEIDLTKNPLELGTAEIMNKKDYEDSIAQRKAKETTVSEETPQYYVELSKEKITVSGLVVSKGKFIPGATVVVKGSTIGTVTDMDGRFMIQAQKGDVLTFGMIGYKSFEYTVKKALDNLVIVLKPDDLVVVGTGMSDLKGDLDGIAISEIKGGTQVIGVRTKNGKIPLYLKDGKPISKEELEKIKPDEIKSISVLKDVSATAIYGKEGANGVVLLTMKNPSQKNTDWQTVKGSPLIVIDGVKMPKDFELNSIKADEIESISVLKGNSAVEMYGNEGKNGVVVITRKSNTLPFGFEKANLEKAPIDYGAIAFVIGDQLATKSEVEALTPDKIKSIDKISSGKTLKNLQDKFNTDKINFMVIKLK